MKRLPYKKRSRKKGPVQSNKVSYDGINFASGLERYMYMALKKAKIRFKYEGETFVLLNGFHFDNEVYERQANGKGEYKIEVVKEYFLSNTLRILLVMIL